MRPTGTKKNGIKYLNDSELEGFFKAVDSAQSSMDSFVFRLILFLGLRVQEAINIKLGDINQDSFQLSVKGIKNGRTRTYDLNGRLWHRFEKWMKERKKISNGNGKNPFLFPSSKYHDEPVTTQALKNGFKSHAEKAGLSRDFSIHCLRHSCGIIHAKKNESAISIMLWLRQRSIKSAQVYFESVEFEEQDERASQNFSAYL